MRVELQRMLGTQHHVLNYGLSGRTLLSAGDHPYRANRFFAHSQKVAPAIVLIMLGTNDAKPHNWDSASYESELREFAEAYRALDSRPAVYLLTPPSAWPNTFTIDTAVVRDEVAPIVRRVAAEIGIPLIDVHDATAQSSGLFRDGIHPDADGNAIIAETVRARLQETTEKSE